MEGELERIIKSPCDALKWVNEFENWLITGTSFVKKSREEYLYHLPRILQFFCDHLLEFTVEGWDKYCELNESLSSATLNLQNATFKKFGEFLLDKEITQYNPFSRFKRLPRERKHEPISVSSNEISQFLKSITNRQDKLMITLLYTLDINLDDFSLLYLENIDKEKMIIRLGDRDLPISKKILKFLPTRTIPLTDISQGLTPLIKNKWGDPAHPRMIQNRVRKLTEKAGFDKPITARIVRKFPEYLAESKQNLLEIYETLGSLPEWRIGKILEHVTKSKDSSEFTNAIITLMKPMTKEITKSVNKVGLPIEVIGNLFSKEAFDSVIDDFDLEEFLYPEDLQEIIEVASKREIEYNIESGSKDIEEYFDTTQLRIPDDLLDRLNILKKRLGLAIDVEKLREIALALVDGHIILSGPPGTGKTVIASEIPRVFFAKNVSLDIDENYSKIITATYDWTTQETIGGLILGKEGGTERYDGEITRAIFKAKEFASKDKSFWLIVDEFNRADIDKAFGSMFTALESQLLAHPYYNFPDGDNIALPPEIVVPSSFRIIGTMNTFDKNALSQLSYGLQRRFRIIPIDLPDLEEEKEIIDVRLAKSHKHIPKLNVILKSSEYQKAKETVFSFINEIRTNKLVKIPIGTAGVLNTLGQIITALSYNSNEAILDYIQRAIVDNICPQFEGIIGEKYDSVINIGHELGLETVKNYLETHRVQVLGS